MKIQKQIDNVNKSINLDDLSSSDSEKNISNQPKKVKVQSVSNPQDQFLKFLSLENEVTKMEHRRKSSMAYKEEELVKQLEPSEDEEEEEDSPV